MGENDATPTGPGRLTAAIKDIKGLRAEVEAQEPEDPEVAQVKVQERGQTIRMGLEICARPKVLWPALAALVLTAGICAGVATGTFSFDLFIDKAVEVVPTGAAPAP